LHATVQHSEDEEELQSTGGNTRAASSVAAAPKCKTRHYTKETNIDIAA